MPKSFTQREILCLSETGFHRLAYRAWGASDSDRVVIAVHGLTRNAQDFDELAAALATAGFYVVCPDIVGRGQSEPLADPAGYGYPQYMADMTALLARLDVAEVDWIGTSMGGLIGMMLAALPQTPIRRLVVNDIGPFIPKEALEDILTYVGKDPLFPDLATAETYFRTTYAPFGPMSDSQWREMARASTRPAEGGFRLNYDPRIAEPFRDAPVKDIDLWSLWDRISGPVLSLRGELSTLLLRETAEEMARRGPRSEIREIADCGHAPSLKTDGQIALVLDWLEQAG
jgi:pimeloyl-ACP methyl ester carboxylesterase